MSPRSVLTLLATLVAGATLCLAGYEVAVRFNQETRSLYGILFAVSAVLTSVVCIGVLDWARNLDGRAALRHRENAPDGGEVTASEGYLPSSEGGSRLLEAVHKLRGLANEELSGDKAVQEALDLLSEFAGAESVSLWTLDSQGSFLPAGECVNGRTLVGAEAVTEPLDRATVEELVQHRKPMETVGELTSAFLVPLHYGARCTGVMKVVVRSDGSDEERNDQAQGILSDLTVLARQLARTVAAPEDYQQAVSDPVTGLYSRRHFVNRLAECASVSRRYGESVSLVLLDVDNLHGCNRAHGEATGDRVLHNVASIIQEAVREADSVYRYGADTIAVVLPATDAAEAMKVAERLRQRIRAGHTLCEDGGRIIATVSVGVAEFDEDMRGITPLMADAEQALAAARTKGGDRVERAEESPGTEPA